MNACANHNTLELCCNQVSVRRIGWMIHTIQKRIAALWRLHTLSAKLIEYFNLSGSITGQTDRPRAAD